MANNKTLEERFQDCFKKRERLDSTYFAASEKLTNEYEALMEELTNGEQ